MPKPRPRETNPKWSEFYETLKRIHGARFNLGIECECKEIIPKPTNNLSQLKIAQENLLAAAVSISQHMIRYHKKELTLHDNDRIDHLFDMP